MESLFFALSKVFAFVQQPLDWVWLLLACALALRLAGRLASAWRCTVAAAAVLAIQSWVPLPEMLMRTLEQHHPRVEFRPGAYHGLVVLSGALHSFPRSGDHEDVMLNGAAERMTKTVELVRRDPNLQVVFTGLSGQLRARGRSEADMARQFFDEQGVDAARVVYEGASRNTWENAQLSARLPGIDPSARWLLVTSAAHMPRSLAVFRKLGWNVAPYPVDFRAGRQMDWLDYSPIDAAELWEAGLHEVVGMAIYMATGKL